MKTNNSLFKAISLKATCQFCNEGTLLVEQTPINSYLIKCSFCEELEVEI